MSELKLPALGDNVNSATVVGVLIQEGQSLEEGQPILELETDKAVMEVPAPQGGTVSKVLVKAGDEVKSGQVIAILEERQSASEPPKQASPEPPAQAELNPPSPAAPASQPPTAPKPAPEPEPSGGPRRLIPAAPSVRRLARELGVDLTQVLGSGPAYRISEKDVRQAVEAPATPAPAPTSPRLPDFSRFGEIRREAMSGVRKATVRSMAQAWSTVPMVTQFDKADITQLEELRRRYAGRAEAQGAKLTTTALLLKAVALTLKAFPKFNASLDLERQEIIYKEYIHLGVAVDTPHGLLVPVLRHADRKGAIELAKELAELAARARERKLTPEEMEGASFSVSNLGGIGGTGFTPIVNWPEVAILGVSRAEVAPVWNPEQQSFLPRTILPFSLTYDHRLIDGADAARFTRHLAELLEDPFLLILE